MLAHLRQRTMDTLASVQTATLATSGPAGIQARVFPCEAQALQLYLLIPGISDHLLNLEYDQTAVISTPEWQLQGRAAIFNLQDAPAGLALTHLPEAAGCVLVCIRPLHLQINRLNGWGFSETIDLEI
jgi:hypothetical protein